MKNELTLKINYDLNYSLIALRSELEDYQFAYFLNKSPFFLFQRLNKDISYVIQKKKIYFSTFQHIDTEFEKTSFLISNKSMYNLDLNSEENLFSNNTIMSTSFLIPELKEFDYFLKLVGIWKTEEIHNLKKYLKKMKDVDSEVNINIDKIKSINNLVL